MKIATIQFDDVRYNPERGAFEALVRLYDDGQTYSYPSHVCAPLHADFRVIARGLTEAARRAHRGKSPGLRSLRRQQTPAPMSPGRVSLIDRLLGSAAA